MSVRDKIALLDYWQDGSCAPRAAVNEGEYLMQIRGWKAQRSGANIRVTGTDKGTQQPVKVTVTSIGPRRGGLVIATQKDGTEHTLVE